jgi:hypothetical protein
VSISSTDQAGRAVADRAGDVEGAGPGRPPSLSASSGEVRPGAQSPEEAAKASRFYAAFEPIAASVYFAPEVHEAFQAAGFGPPSTAEGCLPLADLSAYYCSRAGCMGQVPGEVVVAAFGVFNPDLIIPAVEAGWRIADRDTVLRVRLAGQTAFLQRALGDQPGIERATELLLRAADAGQAGGRFLYAGLRSLPFPEPGWGAMWRAADMVREYRGDCHIAAWVAAGLDPVEAELMTEVFYGMPPKYYHRGRGWREADLDAGLDRLRARGWVDGSRPVHRGRTRGAGVGLIEPWAGQIVAANGYPTDIRQLPPQWGNLE